MSPDLNFEQIVKLVKTWVLSEDRLKLSTNGTANPLLQWPKPVTTDDPVKIKALRDQFAQARTNFVIPRAVTHVVVVQDSPTCFVLKLPAAVAISDHETRLKTHDYPMPPFYTDPQLAPRGHPDAKLRLDDARIGDYTISNCAG